MTFTNVELIGVILPASHLSKTQLIPQHTKLVDICVLNTRSVRNKTEIVKHYVVESNADITALTETWLKTDGQDQNIVEKLKPKGYELPHESRSTGCGGGVGILHKRHVNSNHRNLPSLCLLNT